MYTSIDDVKKIDNLFSYKRAAISKEIYSDFITPIELMRILRNNSDKVFLLESINDKYNWGRYTFLGYEPILNITCKRYDVYINGEFYKRENPKVIIREILKDYKSPKLENMPPFTGGLVGYFSYDYVRYSEKRLDFESKKEDIIDLDLMLFESIICFDNFKQKIILITNVKVDDLDASYKEALNKLDEMESIIRSDKKHNFEDLKIESYFEYEFDEYAYSNIVNKAKGYIKDGDIFQVVLSNTLRAKASGSLFNVYRVLRTINASPYMFYILNNNIEIAGASPETLVKLENDKLYTYPLAGSRPRGKTQKEDLNNEKDLLSDEKELAEHNMLVDLARNDIGKISKIGTVNVEDYMSVERYSHIMHISSTVTGIIRDDKDAIDAIDSILPAGTLSGAPKIRALEIINELETIDRELYGGAIGYIDFSGNMDVCIAIRLVYKKKDNICIRSGAGIVYDSNPKKEFLECINKAKAVVKAIEISKEVF
ncbi:anthranilate synthase component I [Brachyspira murdochii]|uniref:Anthranilate synthase component 1 n=1 Tax=Brachyspira murdochii (strain ATCC 51284 / DSM 12563 / 56-150) TaxID=526224 RepID=D5U427_BRAM5|nr:anthranilate synthase component I [Brachyspira murdochii]ADG72208.1 Anthranilate synthase [Brachyspira murdochii DSM 12563]